MKNFYSRIELLTYFKPHGIGLEIGVHRGDFAKLILEVCPGLTLYLLDCWDYPILNYHDRDYLSLDNQRKNLEQTLRNVLAHFSRVRLIKGYSHEFAYMFPNNFFDFIYIDANHNYESVKQDLNMWYPKLKKNGLFSGHDYFDRIDPEATFFVKKAVTEFANLNNLEIFSTLEDWPSWFCFKQ